MARDRSGTLLRALACLALAFVTFVGGAWVAHRDVFPYRETLRRAFIGVVALAEAYLPRTGRLRTDVWVQPSTGPDEDAPEPGDEERRGVLARDADRMSPGLTLVVVGQNAHLVEADGTIRHTWHRDYGDYGPKGTFVRQPIQSRLYWRPARAFPDGQLMAIVDEYQSPPGGLGLIRLDADSGIEWVYFSRLHHDFDVDGEGRIYVLGKGVRMHPPRHMQRLRGPLLDELVLVLSPEGKLLEERSILDALENSPYRALANRMWDEGESLIGDYLHSNNLDLVTAEVAERFPFAREGQLLLSFREISTLAIMDLERPAIVWARRGEWHRQHDPDFLDNGHILMFDNMGDWDRGGRSRVLEYDPQGHAVVWRYPTDPRDRRMTSRYRGDQQRLPNGNTLITIFQQSRVVEVTPEGDVVWEYLCPFTNPENDQERGRIMYAERYEPGTLQFTFNEGRPAGAAADPP